MSHTKSPEKPYTVIFFNDPHKMGGAEHSLALLLANLPKNIIKPVLVCNEFGEFPQLAENNGITLEITRFNKLFSLKPVQQIKNLISLPMQLKKIRRLAEKHNAKLLHSNTRRMHFITSLAGKFYNIPVVCHLRWIPMNLIENLFTRVYFCLTQPFLIAISQTVKTKMNLNNYKSIKVIHNCTKLQLPDENSIKLIRENSKISKNDKVFIIIGRLEEWKGQIFGLYAFKKLLTKKPDSKLFLVGDDLFSGESTYKNKVLSYVNLELKNNVIVTGHVGNPLDYIAASDCLIHTSICPEPFGRVIIEAMAMKTAVIASHIGGPTEIISHELNGLLCDIKNTNILFEHMLKVISSDKLYDNIVDKAYNTVKEKFSINQHVNSVQNFYKNILHQS